MSDSTPRLPARPSLEQLRKQAKELLQAIRAGDPSAKQRLRTLKPELPRQSSLTPNTSWLASMGLKAGPNSFTTFKLHNLQTFNSTVR